MENTTPEQQQESANAMDQNDNATTNNALIDSFCGITSATKEEAFFFLDSHHWDLNSAVSTFLDDHHHHPPSADASPSESIHPSTDHIPLYFGSPLRSRTRSSSPVQARDGLRSNDKNVQKKPEARGGSGSGISTFSDLNRSGLDIRSHDDDDDDQPQQYYAGGERSGMLVEDPNTRCNADAVFDQAKQSAGNVRRHIRRSGSKSFPGTGRLLSGETVQSVPQPPEAVNHTITLWRNGFTVNDGPLRSFFDPANASFLESIRKSECPKELEPADRSTEVHLQMQRQEENYTEPKRQQTAFQGKGKKLGSSSDPTSTEDSKPTVSAPTVAAPPPTAGLVVDSSLPTTSIQLRLADGTRMVSRFNLRHTVRDVRNFFDASRPGGQRNYQLQTMGFPPKQLLDPSQTIEEAGIASSVVIQRF